ncbi:MAG: Fic family protein [Chloroflexota bacterium]|nr:Fic family protein [Chloroflexota bacterium]MDE2894852.1 Fic family protein [Chloroflexota bacterium]
MSIFLTIIADRDPQLSEQLAALPRLRALARNAVPAGFEEYLRRRAQVQSVHGSVSIEGNPLDVRTVQLATLEVGSSNPHRREASNTNRAYRLIQRLAADPDVRIDEGLLRLFNVTVLDGMPGPAAQRAGQWRSSAAMVINTSTRQFVYTGPPAEWVPGLMSGLIEQISRWQDQDPPEVAAAKAHFSLVSIHPFADGNGRSARLLADLMLAQTGCDADGMIALSGAIFARQAEYYTALQESQGPAFSERVNATPFLRFHTNALVEATRTLSRSATALQRRELALRALVPSMMNVRRITGLNSMLELGQVTTASYADLADCAQTTAFKDLTALIEAGLVRRVGRGKSSSYELTDLATSLLISAESNPERSGE